MLTSPARHHSGGATANLLAVSWRRGPCGRQFDCYSNSFCERFRATTARPSHGYTAGQAGSGTRACAISTSWAETIPYPYRPNKAGLYWNNATLARRAWPSANAVNAAGSMLHAPRSTLPAGQSASARTATDPAPGACRLPGARVELRTSFQARALHF